MAATGLPMSFGENCIAQSPYDKAAFHLGILADLLSQFDKLINERGSAAILQQRLLLAADEQSALERKNSSLQTENDVLKAENQTLRLNLHDARNQIDVLSKQIQDAQQQAANQRSADEEKLLQQISITNGQSTNQLAAQTGMARNMVVHHLHQLENDGFVWGTMDLQDNGNWSLTNDGRKYLINKGRLK
ncbi:MAG: hypothetical protein ACKO0Z_21220 [Betaproteobacteria bacterium]